MVPNGEALPPQRPLVQDTLTSGIGVLFPLTALVAAMHQWLSLSDLFISKTLGIYLVGFLVLFLNLSKHRPQIRFGAANQITLVRTALVALLGGFVGEILSDLLVWLMVFISVISTALDGVDGWLARRFSTESRLGARFDMETDALLILLLSVLVWQLEKAGVWVLAGGGLRYFFLVAGLLVRWLQRDLPPSRRRQTICILQAVSLTVCLIPVIPTPWSACIAATGLVLLVWSFSIDIYWLALDRRHLFERSAT